TEGGFCDECGIDLASQTIKPITVAQLMTSNVANTGNLSCPHCGHKLRPGARHCPNCGKKLSKAATTTTPDSPTQLMAQDGQESALKEELVIGERYRLESILGQGGMGRVWKAYDRHLNKYVVVKTILTPSDDLRVALQKEAEVLINIRHPNIVSVI